MPPELPRARSASNDLRDTSGFLSGVALHLITGDITRERVDAIVNAANSGLLGGGGVDGAIHRAGGSEILAACRALRAGALKDGLPAGQAVETTAGRLDAKYVIHTVGPIWQGGNAGEDDLLASAYTNSLILADSLGCVSIAFPAISTGVYGFPAPRAAGIVYAALSMYFAAGEHSVQDVRLVFFSKDALRVFSENAHP